MDNFKEKVMRKKDKESMKNEGLIKNLKQELEGIEGRYK